MNKLNKVIKFAQHNKDFKWFPQIQLKMHILVCSAVSKLFKLFMANIFSS